ncbi:pilus assembly protein TadG-related protein [Actinomadura scrupuli]|uniref:pilus assembly protein TadG-related protein n=1 Tax=Actinomadura scrupuli TaxID=559629 RepID=UPI003D9737A7
MFTAIFTIAVILLAGLLVDGGLAIHARERAFDIAEQAARAGANEIDEDALRQTGKIRIDPSREVVCGKVNDLVAAYDSKATVDDCRRTDDQVTVTIHLTVHSQLLGLVPGLSTFTMTGTASAHPDEGNP